MGEGRLRYGHLEQFLRLGTKQEVLDILDHCVIYSVASLKADIDKRSPLIWKALFDVKKAGCHKCGHNSTRQHSLFGEDFKTDRPLCLSPTCFAKRQADHLTKNWDPGKFGTPGFRWRREVSYETYTAIYGGRVLKACTECGKFVTLLEIDGQVSIERACLDKSCYRTAYSTKAAAPGEAAKKAGPPEWHGTFFREEFYKQTIPAVCETIPPDNYALLDVALVAILKANRQALAAFARKATGKEATIVRVKDVWNTSRPSAPTRRRSRSRRRPSTWCSRGRGARGQFYHSGYTIGADMRHVLAARSASTSPATGGSTRSTSARRPWGRSSP